MTATQDEVIAELQRANAELRRERDAALVKQAELAKALTQRNSEYGERIAHQSATIDVLRAMSASPGDPQPVFDLMVEHARSFCGADTSGIALAIDGTLYLRAHRGFSGNHASAYEASFPRPVSNDTNFGRTILARAVQQIPDNSIDPSFALATAARSAGVQSHAGVPLLRGGEPIGSLSIARKAPGNFTRTQMELLQIFAEQAVIAISSAEAYRAQKEALEQQTATAEVLQVINANPGNLTLVFDAILDKALGLCEAAFGVLWTYDGERIHAAALRGAPPAFAEFLTQAPHPVGADNAHGRLLSGEPVVHIGDIVEDQAYRSGDPMRRTLVELGGGRTLLAVPLRKDDAFLGDFVIYRQEVRLFSDKQIVLLKSFAAQAVIAMENARLLNEIRQRQEELRITFENMGDGVAMFDETPRLVAWNRKFQEVFNVPDAFLDEHRTYADYIRYLAARGDYGEDADPEEQIRRFTETAGEYHSYERIRPDGRVIEIRHNPVPGGGFVLIYADITERKRNEAEIRAARDAAEEASRTIEAAYRDLKTAQANLIQAEKMASLGQLTAGIAHEIKNPLNFINNFSDLSVEMVGELKEAAAPGFAMLHANRRAEIDDVIGTLTSNLERIAEHGRRADSIVKAMLEHSRGSSLERRMVDLNALIDEAMNLAYHGARAQDQSFNVALERDFGEGIAPIEVNPQDITRVFLNIFANGLYAVTRRAREGGNAGVVPTLKVTTRDAGEAVEIRVRDNGIGIPADIRDKLFQPFFTTKPTGEGTGLGLSITYDIVTKAHGGSITVDSKVGEYSEFTIRLPHSP